MGWFGLGIFTELSERVFESKRLSGRFARLPQPRCIYWKSSWFWIFILWRWASCFFLSGKMTNRPSTRWKSYNELILNVGKWYPEDWHYFPPRSPCWWSHFNSSFPLFGKTHNSRLAQVVRIHHLMIVQYKSGGISFSFLSNFRLIWYHIFSERLSTLIWRDLSSCICISLLNYISVFLTRPTNVLHFFFTFPLSTNQRALCASVFRGVSAVYVSDTSNSPSFVSQNSLSPL